MIVLIKQDLNVVAEDVEVMEFYTGAVLAESALEWLLDESGGCGVVEESILVKFNKFDSDTDRQLDESEAFAMTAMLGLDQVEAEALLATAFRTW